MPVEDNMIMMMIIINEYAENDAGISLREHYKTEQANCNTVEQLSVVMMIIMLMIIYYQ